MPCTAMGKHRPLCCQEVLKLKLLLWLQKLLFLAIISPGECLHSKPERDRQGFSTHKTRLLEITKCSNNRLLTKFQLRASVLHPLQCKSNLLFSKAKHSTITIVPAGDKAGYLKTERSAVQPPLLENGITMTRLPCQICTIWPRPKKRQSTPRWKKVFLWSPRTLKRAQ